MSGLMHAVGAGGAAQEHLGTSCTRVGVVAALTVTAGWVFSVVTADGPGVSLTRRRSNMSTTWILDGHGLDKMRGIPLGCCGLLAVVHEHLGNSCTPIGVVDLRLAVGLRTGSQSDRVAVQECTCVRSAAAVLRGGPIYQGPALW